VNTHRILVARPPRAEHVETDPGGHRRQPAAEVVDRVRVGPVEAEPRLLERVVGLVDRSEHPVGDGAQVRPVGFELVGEQGSRVIGHGSGPSVTFGLGVPSTD
jgi:hypothetical protein